MRILKREVEGGVTLADWHGGFIGISKSKKSWRHVDAYYENCPCCKGAFDLTIELFGFEIMAYNDGGPCLLEALFEDYALADHVLADHASKNIEPELAPPITGQKRRYTRPDLQVRPERLASVSQR
jgi:hypothetical protein